MISKAEWDSKFFKYPVGILNLNNTSLDLKIFLNDAKRFKLVYLFSKLKIENVPLIKLMDKKIIYSKQPSTGEKSKQVVEFASGIHSYDKLLNLAYLSGNYSRFKRDENISNNEFRVMYQEWLNKSIDKKISFKVLVKMEGDELIGFATLNKKNIKTAEIGLIAVDERFQGRGIGTELIRECELLSLEQKLPHLQVATQFENLTARKLYEKNNFSIKSITYVYHYWNL